MKTDKRHPRSTFRADEDFRLRQLVARLGESWTEVAAHMEDRNARQCKERWMNYLSPSILKRSWTDEEDELLLQQVIVNGPVWVEMTKYFPGRTDAHLKNRYLVLMRRARKNRKTEDVTLDTSQSDNQNQITPPWPSSSDWIDWDDNFGWDMNWS
jgi:hypothetical protein